ncbi:outer membrane protein assembly factor BamD [Acinetobacter sp. c2-A9]|uniref:outer membrane protein assembly factor BamD n=1 Tax=Acinetobacter sp. c2-A9 TaxID=3342802 RepID=UPI0035B7CF88
MSLNRSKILMLSTSVVLASTITGCSIFSKKQAEDKGPQANEEVYYQRAMTALDKRQFDQAEKQLKAIDSYYPTSQFIQQVQLDLMYTYFQAKKYPEAIAQVERFLTQYPSHPQADYAYYVRGVANMEQNYDGIIRYTSLRQAHRDNNYLKLAYQNFADFLRRYPNSKFTVDVAQRMQFIGNELAESEMNIARFNIERKAWVAALQRARWVIEYYPETVQIPEALATTVYAYQQLGDTQNAEQYRQIIKLNYPHLLKSNGDVNLNAARHKGSLLNRLSLGTLGRSSTQNVNKEHTMPTANNHASEAKPSLLNRLSFGLLGK